MVRVDRFVVDTLGFAVLDLVAGVVVVDLAADFVVVDFAVLRGVRAVVVLRVVEAAFIARLTGFFDVVALLFVTVVGLREDVLRVVVDALEFAVVAFDGVDFFRADDVLVGFDVVVFLLVVVAFLVAILSLPAK